VAAGDDALTPVSGARQAKGLPNRRGGAGGWTPLVRSRGVDVGKFWCVVPSRFSLSASGYVVPSAEPDHSQPRKKRCVAAHQTTNTFPADSCSFGPLARRPRKGVPPAQGAVRPETGVARVVQKADCRTACIEDARHRRRPVFVLWDFRKGPRPRVPHVDDLLLKGRLRRLSTCAKRC